MKETLIRLSLFLILPVLVLSATPARALEIELHAVQFPERKEIDLDFVSRPGTPAAKVKAEVTFREGQAQIKFEYDNMKPAILYGGDVTCYVLWAVSRSGDAENLGELIVRDSDATSDFYTAKKDFALLVTAEPYYLVPHPSELALFHNKPSGEKRASSNAFRFSSFAPAPDHALKGITHVRWDAETPLELLQARKAFELAGRSGAANHAPRLFRDAERELARTEEYASKGKDKKRQDHARRAVALSNEAINVTMNRLESIELEKQVDERRAELSSIEQQAREAEERARDAEATADRLRLETERFRAETKALAQEKSALALTMSELLKEKTRLGQGL